MQFLLENVRKGYQKLSTDCEAYGRWLTYRAYGLQVS